MDSDEEKIEFIRKFLENAFTDGHIGTYDKYVSSKVLLHGPDRGRKTKGLPTIKEIDGGFTKAFKRKSLKIKDIFCNDDKVVVIWDMKSTHTGNLNVLTKTPIPATNEDVVISAISIYRLEDGLIQEVWQGWDLQGLLLHLKNVHDDRKLDFYEIENRENYIEGAHQLTERELQCLDHLIRGETAKETAQKLHLSFRTIESHLENAKNKLKCESKRELFRAVLFLKRLHLI